MNSATTKGGRGQVSNKLLLPQDNLGETVPSATLPHELRQQGSSEKMLAVGKTGASRHAPYIDHKQIDELPADAFA